MKKWLIGCGGIVVLVLVLAACGGSSSPTTASSAAKPPNKPTQSTSTALVTWEATYGPKLAKFGSDFTAIQNAGSNAAAMSTACSNLTSDIDTAQKWPSIPNATMASNFSSALVYYQQAGVACTAAVSDFINPNATQAQVTADENTMETDTAQGNALIEKLLAEMKAG